MPYNNLPREKWPKMEKCTADLKAKGKVDNIYAVCYSSIMGTIKKDLGNRREKSIKSKK